MSQLSINNQLSLTYPDTFHEMTDAEKATLNFAFGDAAACLFDPESHSIVTIGFNKINGFASMMLNVKDIAKQTEKTIAQANAQFQYHSNGFSSMTYSGQQSQSFTYDYVAQDTPMYGQCTVFKYKKTIYYFFYYTRQSSLQNTEAGDMQRILSSLKWQ